MEYITGIKSILCVIQEMIYLYANFRLHLLNSLGVIVAQTSILSHL